MSAYHMVIGLPVSIRVAPDALYALADRVAATLANAEQFPYAVIPAH